MRQHSGSEGRSIGIPAKCSGTCPRRCGWMQRGQVYQQLTRVPGSEEVPISVPTCDFYRWSAISTLNVAQKWSQGSSVSKGTKLRTERPDFDSQQRHSRDFSRTALRPALRPIYPPIQCVLGAFPLKVKRLEREADHSLASRDEIKNACWYTSIHQFVFIALYLIKHGIRHGIRTRVRAVLLFRPLDCSFILRIFSHNCRVCYITCRNKLLINI
jgi:hypothetical protein